MSHNLTLFSKIQNFNTNKRGKVQAVQLKPKRNKNKKFSKVGQSLKQLLVEHHNHKEGIQTIV